MAMTKAISYDVAGYEEFQLRARDSELSGNQKAGFPDELRVGKSQSILSDIIFKMPAFGRPGASILDIGIGCSDLSHTIVAHAAELRQKLTLIDSPEVLAALPTGPNITKIGGPFPQCLRESKNMGSFDAILAYSVVQYVFAESSIQQFVDQALRLLNAMDGAFLIGDIPNVSMRKRFLISEAGRVYHSEHYAGQPSPIVQFNSLDLGQIDDAAMLGLVARARNSGFQAFILPQDPSLPMANRREDILIRRP